MNMIKNFTKETKKTIVKQAVKKTASVAKKFGIAAAAVGLIVFGVAAVKKSSRKIKTNRISSKSGKKAKNYIDVELLSEEEELLMIEDKKNKKRKVTRTESGELVVEGEK